MRADPLDLASDPIWGRFCLAADPNSTPWLQRQAKRARQNRWVKVKRKQVALESAVEEACCALLREHGCLALKFGKEGWPDRLVLLGNGFHVWFEFKRAKFGGLTPAQRRRIPALRKAGELVFIVKDAHTGLVEALNARKALPTMNRELV